MAQENHKVKVVDHFQVSPPTGSLPTNASLPLTFFDLPWLVCLPLQRLFFYRYPLAVHHFTQTTLPSLKTSLSLTLQHFFPFVSNLICPPPPQKPYILFTEGNSVSFTVAQYSGGDGFDQVISDQAKDVRVLHPFVPGLPPTRVLPDGTHVEPLLAVQVTHFPEQGVCIGITFSHVAADGSAFNNFMKSWASVCKSKYSSTCNIAGVDKLWMPSFDRDLIKDNCEFESKMLQNWRNWACQGHKISDSTFADKVRSTLVMGRAQIERLKQYVSSRGFNNNNDIDKVYPSTFVVTCSFILVCLIKSLGSSANDNDNNNEELCCLVFLADCRNRFGFPIPTTYFGNCLATCFVEIKRKELVRDNGVIVAAKSIGNIIKELESSGGALRALAKCAERNPKHFISGQIIPVAGSPKLSVYKTDFGWGCPNKTEVVHIDAQCAISLAECRDEEGGVEIGLALKRPQMDTFTQLFEQGLKLL